MRRNKQLNGDSFHSGYIIRRTFCSLVRSGNAIFEKFENLRREIKSFPSKLSFRISHGWIEGQGEFFPLRNFFYPITVYALPICPVNFERNEFCGPKGNKERCVEESVAEEFGQKGE